MAWSRPPGPLRVWDTVEIVKHDSGEKMKFTIQEIPEERYDEVLDELMCNYFLQDEALCKTSNILEDPASVDAFRDFWKNILSQGVSIGAFEENGSDKRPIAAANMLCVSDKESKESIKPITSSMKNHEKVLTFAINSSEEANVCNRYGVDLYIGAVGLSTHPRYRRLGLGKRLLEARRQMGKYYDIKVTSTLFTSKVSQGTAEKAGYETYFEGSYDDAVDENGDVAFPGLKGKKYKVMEKKLL